MSEPALSDSEYLSRQSVFLGQLPEGFSGANAYQSSGVSLK
ncbi:MAG: hypothetical protein ACJ0HO_04650 [Candidatus Thalassarchaeum sp.]